ncbi:1-acyl-sn-glycerol-3-phosphate acyltransferase [Candidatus Woesearchaeota archaeon]|nr:1-acyl-sn-glycerol-3-phosphate acyltransferase [Candidatus Woesearchaeota archaeon]
MHNLEDVIDTSLNYINEHRGSLSEEEIALEREELLRLAANHKRWFLHIVSGLSRVLLPSIGDTHKTILGKVHLYVHEDATPEKLNVPGKAVVIVASHASNLDSLIIGMQFFRKKYVLPVLAAGDNLYKNDLLRQLFKWSGAFELQRKFPSDNGVYATRIKSYVSALMENDVPMLFFPEGGRSKEGDLKDFQTVLLSMVLESGIKKLTDASSHVDDVLFVPIGNTYTIIPEEEKFLRDSDAKAEKSNLFMDFLKLGLFMKPVYIQIGEPVSMKEYVLAKKTHFKVLKYIMTSDKLNVGGIIDTKLFLKSAAYRVKQLKNIIRPLYNQRGRPEDISELLNLFEIYLPSERQRRNILADVFANDIRKSVARNVPVLEDHVRGQAVVELVEEDGEHVISSELWSERTNELIGSLRKYGHRIIKSKHTMGAYIRDKQKRQQLYGEGKNLFVKEIERFKLYGNRIKSLLHTEKKNN